jgi:hypothetical protein
MYLTTQLKHQMRRQKEKEGGKSSSSSIKSLSTEEIELLKRLEEKVAQFYFFCFFYFYFYFVCLFIYLFAHY